MAGDRVKDSVAERFFTVVVVVVAGNDVDGFCDCGSGMGVICVVVTTFGPDGVSMILERLSHFFNIPLIVMRPV